VPAFGETVALEGLAGLQRAFKLADEAAEKDLKKRLRESAEPVAADAQSKALTEILTVGVDWADMRVGVTQASVYIAPKQRGTNVPTRKRPKFAGLMLGKAMIPALQENTDNIMASVDDLLAEIGRKWEAVPNG
jgi:hypothetical protein